MNKKILRSSEEWLEMFPYGVSFSVEEFATQTRPVMFFKDKDEKFVLPIWLSPLEAGIALSENSPQPSSPHGMANKLLKSLDMKLEKCLFVDLKGPHQFVELHFKGSRKLKTLHCRADEAISFCLNEKTNFFCQVGFIEKCRVLEAEMLENQFMQKNIVNHNPYPYMN